MSCLPGLKILVVEDDALIALNMEEFLASLGCEVVGPAGRLAEALALADRHALDGAVLDINLHGEVVYPLAERLMTLHIPVIFCSGYALTPSVPARFSHLPQIPKPCAEDTLRLAMEETFGGRKARVNAAHHMQAE